MRTRESKFQIELVRGLRLLLLHFMHFMRMHFLESFQSQIQHPSQLASKSPQSRNLTLICSKAFFSPSTQSHPTKVEVCGARSKTIKKFGKLHRKCILELSCYILKISHFQLEINVLCFFFCFKWVKIIFKNVKNKNMCIVLMEDVQKLKIARWDNIHAPKLSCRTSVTKLPSIILPPKLPRGGGEPKSKYTKSDTNMLQGLSPPSNWPINVIKTN